MDIYVAGTRERKTFSSESAARTHKRQREKQIKNMGTEAASIPHEKLLAFLEAERILAPYGLSMIEAAREVAKKRGRPADAPTMKVLFSRLVESKRKANKRPRYVRALESAYRLMGERWEHKRVSDLTATDVERFLDTHTDHPTTRRNYLRDLSIALNFAVRKGWIGGNVCDGIERPDVEESEVGILTVDQCEQLMTAAVNFGRGMAQAVAVNLFAGLRPVEVESLRWQDIDLKRREILVRSTKVRSRRMRYTDTSDNLAAWLELCPLSRRKGLVCDTDYGRRLTRIHRKAEIEPWPHDACRHSYGSYHFAKHQNAALTAAQMGHKGEGMLFEHYRRLVTREAAEGFWEIRPQR